MNSQLLQSPLKLMTRHFSSSSTRLVREIKKSEEGKTITVEGLKYESPRAKNLIDPKMFAESSCEAYSNCHALCRFDKVHEIKHTDVLIINQFVDNNGEVIPRYITGLCERQHFRMARLAGMAQKAGLLGSKDRFKEEKTSTTKPWAKYNSYWDEKTIDIQWLDKERKKKIRSFKKSKK